MPTMIDNTERLDGRTLAFYLPNLSTAALYAIIRWAGQCRCWRLSQWLVALAEGELERRREDNPPVEADLPKLDVEAFAAYELIQAMDEAFGMAVAVARMDAPMGKLTVLMYATLSAEAQQRARRGEP
ncbi:MAG: hypothetical protein WD534_00970 [Phycisphaeraceae bacterium]